MLRNDNKSFYSRLRNKDPCTYELLYAIKRQAFRDLASNSHVSYLQENSRSLIDFCNSFFIENKYVNDILLNKALYRRGIKMLKEFIKELENLQIEVLKMKMSLDKMYAEMLKGEPTPEKAIEPQNEADEIEEKLEAQTPTPTPTPTPAPTPTPTQTPEEAIEEVTEEKEN